VSTVKALQVITSNFETFNNILKVFEEVCHHGRDDGAAKAQEAMTFCRSKLAYFTLSGCTQG